MKKCLSMLLATLLLLACIPLSASAACGIAGHRVTEPTCIEEGYCRDCGIVYAALGHRFNEMGICEYCGEKKGVQPDVPSVPSEPEDPELPEDPTVCEHEWTIGATREPTCMEDGLWEYYCTLCYERMVEFLPATGEHLYDEHGYCEYCGKQEETDECRHEWQELMFIEPSCINEGVWERYCTRCYRREVEFFPATGIHIYDDDYDPECNYCGEWRDVGEPEECHHEYDESGFCIHCGEMVEFNPDLPCTHENASQPTCTTDGVCFDCGVRFSSLSHAYNEKGICENCGERIEIDLPCTHENSIPSTCTEYGFCYDCGLMFEVLGHQYNEKGICNYCGDKNEIEEPEECVHEWLKTMVANPTCIHEGVQELYCPLCGRCEIKSIPATGEHVYSENGICEYCGEKKEVEPDLPDVPVVPEVCEHWNGRQPTCTEKGYCSDCGLMFAPLGHLFNEMGICEYCGEKQEIEPDLPDVPVIPDVCEHEYVENVLRIPTCNDEGLIEYYCVVCGYHYTVDVPATGEHTYDDEYDEFCNVCGGWREVEDKPVEPDVCHHEWVDGVMKDPTCFSEGIYERYCTLCYERHVERVPALLHEYTAEGVCVHCGDQIVPEECHHEWVDGVVIEPTCMEDGLREYYCIQCYERHVEILPATGEHVYSENGICDYCGEKQEIEPDLPDVPVVPDLPCTHEHGRQPTCTEEGYCSDCGLMFAPFGHLFNEMGICEYCGEKKEIEPDLPDVPVVPDVCEHEYEYECAQVCALCGELTRPDAECVEYEWVEVRGDGVHVINYECRYCHEPLRGYAEECYGGAATCDKLAECAVCGREYGDYADHDYNAVVTAPDCVSGGYTTYTCTVCGDSYVADQTAARSHDYNAVVTAPDCVSGGYTTYTCTVCGDSYVTDQTAARGHDYNAATCTAPKTCKVCGATDGDKLSHRYDNGAVTTAPTCTATGVKTYTCTACGDTYTKSIAKVAHDYNAATCTAPKTCKVCGVTSGSKLSHDYAAATCTAPKTCKNCGITSGKKLGHTYSNDCDKSCNRCKATRTVGGHDYKKVVTKATLTKNGVIKNVCEECGYTSSKSTTIYKISAVELSATTYTYSGSAKKPSVTVEDSKGKKISSSYYTVTYASGRKNVGTYKVTVKFKGNYSGTKTLTFKIIPTKTTLGTLTAAKKALTVKWTKKTAQVTGYEVQYGTSKSFKSYKSKIISKNSTTSVKLTGLKAKTTYYVRIRTYKTVNGKKYYSGWSTIKYKKTK